MKGLIKSVAFLGSSFFFLNAEAGTLSQHSPNEVCNFLRNHGMEAHEWRLDRYNANAYECNSFYKELDNGYPMSNNIAYYVTGIESSALKAKLFLNVNDSSKTKTARAALLKESEYLASKIGNIKLPKNIRDAILRAEPASSEDKGVVMEVDPDFWGEGAVPGGHQIQVIFYEEKK